MKWNKKKPIDKPQPKEVLEPIVAIKKTSNGIEVSAQLPGVKSEEDVEVNFLPNSIELRAFAGERGYFKILNIPNNFDLIEKNLKDERLRLQFSSED